MVHTHDDAPSSTPSSHSLDIPASPAHSFDQIHELRPLIGRSMEDVKDLNVDDTRTPPDGRPNPHNDDPEMEGLTLYEKKALLVNRELDSHGMGKYQWYIFFLCGFGYLIDLLYAQAFGLVEPAIQQEFGFGGSYSTYIALSHLRISSFFRRSSVR